MAGLTTVTSGGISDGTITNADINASAAIDASKISGLSTDSITEGNTTVECVDTGSDGHITFDTENSEKMRIDSSGRLLVATTSSRDQYNNTTGQAPKVQIETVAGESSNTLGIARNSANNAESRFVLAKSRGTTAGSATIVSSGDSIGTISFQGADGTDLVEAAAITAQVDGTPGDNDMPGRLVFSTTADSASSPTERMRIDSSGRVGIGVTPSDFGANSKVLEIHSSSSVNSFLSLTNSTTGSNGAANGFNIIMSNNEARLFNREAGDMTFWTSGTQRMTINSSGNVGIGTSTPGSLIEVKGAAGSVAGISLGDVGDSITASRYIGICNASDHTDISGNSGFSGIEFGGPGSTDEGYLAFHIHDSGVSSGERVRIRKDGFLIASNNGTYASSSTNHYFQSDLSASGVIVVTAFNNSYTGIVQQNACLRSASSAYSFFKGVSGNGTTAFADNEHNLRGDGNAFADGSFSGGGADYAEYFEWSDENINEEDRRGISVVLDGDKIRPALSGEDPIGVISGNPSVVGDAAWNKWNGKYLRDDYGTYIQEDYEVEDEEGNIVTQQRRKLNPNYDPDQEYISREDRPEWDCVGIMGKLRIRKGQPVGSRWIKMRDISDSVEEWLVR